MMKPALAALAAAALALSPSTALAHAKL